MKYIQVTLCPIKKKKKSPLCLYYEFKLKTVLANFSFKRKMLTRLVFGFFCSWLVGCFFFSPSPIFLFISSSSNTPENWAGHLCPSPAPPLLHGSSGSSRISKGTLWHTELFQPRSLPPLLESFSLAVCRSLSALKSTWVFSSCSEMCILTSSVCVSLFQIFLGEFFAFFSTCFFSFCFALIILEGVGGGET